MMITGTSLASSRQALELATKYDLSATVGCHPTSTTEIAEHEDGVEAYFNALETLVAEEVKKPESKLVAIGEIGLGECMDWWLTDKGG